MRAVIIDDEKKGRETLQSFINSYCQSLEIVGNAGNVAEGLSLIDNVNPEVVFLDIQMPDGTGFDLLNRVTKINFQFIFVTAFDNYAIKAFQFSAVDYLLKPVNPTLLVKAVEKLKDKVNFHLPSTQIEVLEANQSKIEKLIITTENKTHVLQVSDIIRCQADNYYTIFVLKDDTKVVASKTLKEYTSMLEELNFLRIHQSHLINLSFIEDYRFGPTNYVLLQNKEKIEISRRRKKAFLEKIAS